MGLDIFNILLHALKRALKTKVTFRVYETKTGSAIPRDFKWRIEVSWNRNREKYRIKQKIGRKKEMFFADKELAKTFLVDLLTVNTKIFVFRTGTLIPPE